MTLSRRMKPTVYLETSVFGYLTSRPSEILIVAGNQQLTRKWWDEKRDDFELRVSEYVLLECSMGDQSAATERAAILDGIPVLDVDDRAFELAAALVSDVPLPSKAQIDASHIALAAVHGVQYLLTWNCKHIANPSLRAKLHAICRREGFELPLICTPVEMWEL